MIIGIDPGFTGAIAFLADTRSLEIYDMPTHLIMGRKQVDGEELAFLLGEIRKGRHKIQYAAVEDVSAMPEQGVTSTFRFGYSAGIVMGVLQALEIKVLRVKPSVWKPALGLSSDKKKSLALARKRFPQYKAYFKRAMDDGRAEAALLAHFAREMS
jgi:crossover junction endodeoxyribonuclease RuvC